jgi:hypothetical protein
VGVVIEAAGIRHRRFQRVLAGMAERRMPEVMRQAERFRQILIQAESPGDRSADLRYFDAVREPDPVMVAVGGNENLSLVSKSPERDRVDDAIAVALKNIAGATRPGVDFRMGPAAR